MKKISEILFALIIITSVSFASPSTKPTATDSKDGNFTASIFCLPTLSITSPLANDDGKFIVDLGYFFIGTDELINDPSKRITWVLRGPIGPAPGVYFDYTVTITEPNNSDFTDQVIGGSDAGGNPIPADPVTSLITRWQIDFLNHHRTHNNFPNFNPGSPAGAVHLEPETGVQGTCNGIATFQIIAYEIIVGTEVEPGVKYFDMTLTASVTL